MFAFSDGARKVSTDVRIAEEEASTATMSLPDDSSITVSPFKSAPAKDAIVPASIADARPSHKFNLYQLADIKESRMEALSQSLDTLCACDLISSRSSWLMAKTSGCREMVVYHCLRACGQVRHNDAGSGTPCRG